MGEVVLKKRPPDPRSSNPFPSGKPSRIDGGSTPRMGRTSAGAGSADQARKYFNSSLNLILADDLTYASAVKKIGFSFKG